jgi:hypothetical protein
MENDWQFKKANRFYAHCKIAKGGFRSSKCAIQSQKVPMPERTGEN